MGSWSASLRAVYQYVCNERYLLVLVPGVWYTLFEANEIYYHDVLQLNERAGPQTKTYQSRLVKQVGARH